MPRKNAFTLIELLVVIVIIAVLSSIALTSFQGTQGKGRDAVRKTNLNQLATALEAYFQKNNSYITPAGAGADDCLRDTTKFYDPLNGIAPYMSNLSVPKDPKTGAFYCYISINNGGSYRLFAKLENCTETGVNFLCSDSNYNYTVYSSDLLASSATGVAPTPTPVPTPTPTPPPFRYVFITSSQYSGDLIGAANALGLSPTSGLDAANKLCKYKADNSTVTAIRDKSWKAWLADSSHTPADQTDGDVWTQSTVPYKQVNGITTVANDWTDLTNGDIASAINLTENNGNPAATSSIGCATTRHVRSNLNTSGNKLGATDTYCSDWATTSGNFNGVSGDYAVTTSGWTAACNGSFSCTGLIPLYCFEQ